MLTPGKLAGMKAVSDARGVIAAAAMDQRGSLQKSLAKERGGDVSDHDMEEFKAHRHGSAHTARQRDSARPRVGHCPPASDARKMPGCSWPTRRPGTTRPAPAACPTSSTTGPFAALKEAGADCIKILLYYTPDDPQDVNNKKHAWVERIGDECRANDIPFFLEFVGYDESLDEKGPSTRGRSPTSSSAACASSARTATASTC